MPELKCIYRIYPAWFGGDSAAPAMKELAERAASRMRRQVKDIEIAGHGEDGRGHFIDFRVSYSDVRTTVEWELSHD